ncbi:fungal hydrophobin-domain-containing protein [Trametes elegans]|nr:fungal hydrophobin-domain-containing protein [Trametes elegans]
MMFVNRALAFFYFVLSLSLLAAAMPAPGGGDAGSNCSTGNLQCCNSVVESNSDSANLLLGLLGIVLGDLTGLIGLNCSPLSVIGIGTGNACSSNAVCCTNNNVGGLLSVGYPQAEDRSREWFYSDLIAAWLSSIFVFL